MSAQSRAISTAAGLALGLLTILQPPAANAQSLNNEVKRLQRELNTLQRYVYKGEQPPASAITGVYGTEGAVSQTEAARLELRLSQLEAELRAMTGGIEEQAFRIDRLNKRMDNLVADMDNRLRRLEERSGGRTAAPAAAGASLGGEPGILGTVSPEAVAAVRAQGVETAGVGTAGVETGSAASSQSTRSAAYSLPGATPEANYKHAFGLLSQANYDQAERALNAFLEQHPTHGLAGNAKYWLGETYYVRGQYNDAAVAFAEGYQQYPDSSKAPDNLFKLGKSLALLGSTTDACGTYSELLRRFPGASANVLQQAQRERRRLACP